MGKHAHRIPTQAHLDTMTDARLWHLIADCTSIHRHGDANVNEMIDEMLPAYLDEYDRRERKASDKAAESLIAAIKANTGPWKAMSGMLNHLN